MRLVTLFSLLAVCTIAVPAKGVVLNGGFETGNFSSWDTIGSSDNPAILTAAFGSGPTEGIFQAGMITARSFGAGVVPVDEIETFLGLNAGSLDALIGGDAREGAAIRQTISANAGDVLSFDWNFLTNEDVNGNDFAFWSLVGAPVPMLIADISGSSFVPSSTAVFDLETGFNTVDFVIPASGQYTLGFGVASEGTEDFLPFLFASGLLVDNVNQTVIPEPATFVVWSILGICGVSAGYWRRRRKTAA